MNAIGGYFPLELPCSSEPYHKGALALNTGRNCLEYILRVREYKKVFLPYYSCEVLLEPFAKLGIEYSFYHINDRLELSDPIDLGKREAILYINYFGLKQDYVEALSQKYGNRLIVDNTQAFFASPIEGVDTFYSCRKFFGVADGAYLYCDKRLDGELEQDYSWQRMDYLLKRIDLSPEDGYADFKKQDELLKDNPIRRMSSLTQRIMGSIDYTSVATRRRDNYKLLDDALRSVNGIALPLAEDAVPMVYPFLTADMGLRQRLIDNKIYVAQYWPNVLEWCDETSVEYNLTLQLVALPVDQRNKSSHINIISNCITK